MQLKINSPVSAFIRTLCIRLGYNIVSMAKTFLVSVRLQRVTTETAHVSVPLSDELFQLNPEGSGTNTINAEKLIAAAIDLGRHPATHWSVEGEVVITPHPIQTPPQ